MREFKFRMWHEYLDKLVYFNIDDTPDLELAHSVMQCTGLVDKNGKDIYEGDIVSNSDKTQIVEIGFRKGRFGCIAKQDKEYLSDVDHQYIERYTEIIGNIYKNPELVE